MRECLKKEQNRIGRLPLTWTHLEPEAGEVLVCKTIMNLQLARAVLKEIHEKSLQRPLRQNIWSMQASMAVTGVIKPSLLPVKDETQGLLQIAGSADFLPSKDSLFKLKPLKVQAFVFTLGKSIHKQITPRQSGYNTANQLTSLSSSLSVLKLCLITLVALDQPQVSDGIYSTNSY